MFLTSIDHYYDAKLVSNISKNHIMAISGMRRKTILPSSNGYKNPLKTQQKLNLFLNTVFLPLLPKGNCQAK